MSTARLDSRTERPAGARARPLGIRLALSACGLLAVAAARPAAAQVAPPANPAPACPPPAYASPGPAANPMVPTPPPQPSCTCGDRRGLSRLRWHMTRCRRHLQAAAIGYPEEFNEWPLGRAVYANASTQVDNGMVARMIFNDYDFVPGGGQLNLRGRDKLAAMAAALPTCFAPVVIERTPYAPGLDEERRLEVLRGLAAGAFPVPAERVVIGPPIANGQRGVESIVVERNRMSSVAAGSAFNTPAGGAGGVGGLGGVGSAGTGVGPGSFDGSGLSGSSVTSGVVR